MKKVLHRIAAAIEEYPFGSAAIVCAVFGAVLIVALQLAGK